MSTIAHEHSNSICQKGNSSRTNLKNLPNKQWVINAGKTSFPRANKQALIDKLLKRRFIVK